MINVDAENVCNSTTQQELSRRHNTKDVQHRNGFRLFLPKHGRGGVSLVSGMINGQIQNALKWYRTYSVSILYGNIAIFRDLEAF